MPGELGGNFGAGGKLVRLGGPLLAGAFGGAPVAGLFGGPFPGALGGPPTVGDTVAVVAEGISCAGAGLPLNKLNKVLAAAVLAIPSEGATIFLEDVLTVFNSGSIETFFKSFKALFNDFTKSLIPLTVSSKSSIKEVKPFFIKLTTLSIFLYSFETIASSFPPNF